MNRYDLERAIDALSERLDSVAEKLRAEFRRDQRKDAEVIVLRGDDPLSPPIRVKYDEVLHGDVVCGYWAHREGEQISYSNFRNMVRRCISCGRIIPAHRIVWTKISFKYGGRLWSEGARTCADCHHFYRALEKEINDVQSLIATLEKILERPTAMSIDSSSFEKKRRTK